MRKTWLAWLVVPLLGLVGCEGAGVLSLPRPADPAATADEAQAGPVRVYFTRPGTPPADPQNPARVLADYVDQAQKTIDVCAFELDNKVITDALVRAVRRGVKVRLVTETNYIDESGVAALRAVGVPVVDDQRDGALMHNKFMVFDEKAVWTGSMNFTENCAYRNNNNGFYIDDARVAANYATKFRWMFEQRKFGGAPGRTARIPNPQVTLSDGTELENYFSTHDHVADRLVAEINRARQSLHFLAFSFTHKAMGEAMLGRAETGVQVQGVFEKSQATSSYSEFNHFRSFGRKVEVYTDANSYNMHHKVIVIDGQTTVAGSFNFSDGADKQNDENVVIFRSRKIAERFEAEFRRVFGAAKKAATTGELVDARK
jgi:phosphatidylserine/phosphatidylglycerophosphate/cardiolipin synthase-like enzyme